MKTIQRGEEILRVSNEEANAKVGVSWKFVPKSVWKEKVRDVNKRVKEPENQTIAEKQLKSKKNKKKD
jgi:hypothetical protein